MSSKIQQLADTISRNTAIVDAYLKENNLPGPSFDVDAPQQLIPLEATEANAARQAAIEASRELQELLKGPKEYLMSFSNSDLISQQAIIRFKLAHAIPIHGEASFAELADLCGLDERDVRRLLRHAIARNIFCEPRKGYVRHSAVSRLLAEDQAIHDWVGCNVDELWQASARTVDALIRYPKSQEPNETGFALANNTDKAMYEYFEEHPERARRFANAMTHFTKQPGLDPSHVAIGFFWETLTNGLVIDVGGSQGHVSIELVRRFPNFRCIVQDLEVVITDAKKQFDERTDLSDDVRARVEFQTHDFLKSQPVTNVDVFLLRWILHNWSDKYCIKILRNLIGVMKPGARVVVCDGVMPEPGTVPQAVERGLRSMDLAMLEIQNSREREVDEWRQLFEAADSRFRFQGVDQPVGSMLFMIVAKWEE